MTTTTTSTTGIIRLPYTSATSARDSISIIDRNAILSASPYRIWSLPPRRSPIKFIACSSVAFCQPATWHRTGHKDGVCRTVFACIAVVVVGTLSVRIYSECVRVSIWGRIHIGRILCRSIINGGSFANIIPSLCIAHAMPCQDAEHQRCYRRSEIWKSRRRSDVWPFRCFVCVFIFFCETIHKSC